MTPSGSRTADPGWWLAVDFGTSFTTAAVRVGGRVEILEIDSSRYLPSQVCLDPDGGLLVGRDAVSEGATRPSHLERVPKRAMATAEHVRLGEQTVETVDLVAAVLRRVLAETARRGLGGAPSRVVLTHPARWQRGGVELRRLTDAAGRAGLREPELVAEPVAAAHYYVRATGTDLPTDAAIGVYDLGGGTFDTAVLRRRRDGFELAGPPGGDLHLGGEDLDVELMQLLGTHAEALDPEPWGALWDAEGRAAERDRAQLRRDITTAKESLSSRATVTLYVPGYDDEFRLTRGEYEKAIEPVLERSVTELVDTIGRAGSTPQGLADLYLTGGSSRTPRITGLLSTLLRRVPTVKGDPKAVVVQGALETAPGTVSVTTRLPQPTSDAAALNEVARDLTAVAAVAGVGDLIGVVALPEGPGDPTRHLRGAVDDIGLAIARRFSPFSALPPEVSLQLLREGRSELGELGRSLTRLDRLAARLEGLPRRGANGS